MATATKERPSAEQTRIINKEARKVVLDKFAAEFGMDRSWTRSGDFIALFLLKTFDFQMTSEYRGALTNFTGVCNKCGVSGTSQWSYIQQGGSPCTSWLCTGRGIPPDEVFVDNLREHGLELVGTHPTSASEQIEVRHVGGDTPCQQVFDVYWAILQFNWNCRVCSNQQVVVGFNDLATVLPDLAAEMLYEDPTTFTSSSTKKVWWECSVCGYTREQMVNHRAAGVGCGVCSGFKVLAGFNDLATTRPELAEEMIWPDPTTVTRGSAKSARWCCSKCGNEWETFTVARRGSGGHGCPECKFGGFDLASPSGTVYVSNHATEVGRPRRRMGKCGVTKRFDKRRREHEISKLNFRDGSISMLTHSDPYVAKTIEDMIHNGMKAADLTITDVDLQKDGKPLAPKEIFRVRKVRVDDEIFADIYDLLDWVQVQTDEGLAQALGINDEVFCTDCDGAVQYPISSLVHTQI